MCTKRARYINIHDIGAVVLVIVDIPVINLVTSTPLSLPHP